MPCRGDYYGIKTLIDDLEKQGILSPAETEAGLILTSQALNILLNYLIGGGMRGKGLRGATDSGRTRADERKYEIRRYSAGDVFRDISVRHTLKEIARQKKDLSNIRRSDFRVFMNGNAVNPLTIKSPPTEPVAAKYMAAYTTHRDSMMTKLNAIKNF